MCAAYYRASYMQAAMPIGLYATIAAAKAACVKCAGRFGSVTIRKRDFGWHEYTNGNAEVVRAVATVLNLFEFNIKMVEADPPEEDGS